MRKVACLLLLLLPLITSGCGGKEVENDIQPASVDAMMKEQAAQAKPKEESKSPNVTGTDSGHTPENPPLASSPK